MSVRRVLRVVPLFACAACVVPVDLGTSVAQEPSADAGDPNALTLDATPTEQGAFDGTFIEEIVPEFDSGPPGDSGVVPVGSEGGVGDPSDGASEDAMPLPDAASGMDAGFDAAAGFDS